MQQKTADPEMFAGMIAGLEQAGLSRTEIAREAGLSRNTIWRAATGMWREPDHQSVVKLDRIFQRAVTPVEQLKR
jgi:lambda repressor-like predicted transcriptional regulator